MAELRFWLGVAEDGVSGVMIVSSLKYWKRNGKKSCSGLDGLRKNRYICFVNCACNEWNGLIPL